MNKFFYVTFNLEEVDVFKPTVPRYTVLSEDRRTPRICVCKTIEECISAFSGAGMLRRWNEDSYNLLRVFEFEEIEEQYILSPNEIVKRVPDAIKNNEHWIVNRELKPSSSYIIECTSGWFDQSDGTVYDIKYRLIEQDVSPFVKLSMSRIFHGKDSDEDSVHFNRMIMGLFKDTLEKRFTSAESYSKVTLIDGRMQLDAIIDTRGVGRPLDIWSCIRKLYLCYDVQIDECRDITSEEYELLKEASKEQGFKKFKEPVDIRMGVFNDPLNKVSSYYIDILESCGTFRDEERKVLEKPNFMKVWLKRKYKNDNKQVYVIAYYAQKYSTNSGTLDVQPYLVFPEDNALVPLKEMNLTTPPSKLHSVLRKCVLAELDIREYVYSFDYGHYMSDLKFAKKVQIDDPNRGAEFYTPILEREKLMNEAIAVFEEIEAM